MRTLVFIVIVLLLAVSACAAPPRPAVARIAVEMAQSTGHGSGVLVSASGTTGIVLTNWHVVRPPRKSITVNWPDGTSSAGSVVAADSEWDLAAIQVARPDAKPLKLASKAPGRGERLTIAGYGPGQYLEQSGPVVQYMAPAKSDAFELIRLQAPPRLGDSGGPMLNAEGELAGVLYGNHAGCAVGPCCTRISDFLDSVGLVAEEGP